MAKKIIGYQIVSKNEPEMPEGLWSFEIFVALEDAREYLETEVRPEERDKYTIISIREDDIEDPYFILPKNKEMSKQFGFTIRNSKNKQFPYYVECCDECMTLEEIQEKAAHIRKHLCWQNM